MSFRWFAVSTIAGFAGFIALPDTTGIRPLLAAVMFGFSGMAWFVAVTTLLEGEK